MAVDDIGMRMENDPKHSATMTCLKPRSEESETVGHDMFLHRRRFLATGGRYTWSVEGVWVDLATLGTPRLSVSVLVVMTGMGRGTIPVFSRSYK